MIVNEILAGFMFIRERTVLVKNDCGAGDLARGFPGLLVDWHSLRKRLKQYVRDHLCLRTEPAPKITDHNLVDDRFDNVSNAP
jgi:hypothetical protein